ncbi:MAG: DinB family protein [Gemmatimonadota bacterium]|nr:DinB family protein [Gemmatimonadota bacterium]
MSRIQPWFDRKFDTACPVERLAPLLVRLRGCPARLEELVRGVSPTALIARTDGSWSAQENAGHLLDLEPLWLARVGDYGAGRDALTAADLTNERTDRANHNAAPIDGILAGFRNARAGLLAAAEAVDASRRSHVLLHPRLRTPMTLADHLFFVAEHDDHHLARIWELTR